MKINFLLLTIITAAITGCSTSYKAGQTPDDVYYSPARLQTDEVRREREQNNSVDNTVFSDSEDREIRRRVYNRRNRRYHDRYDRYDYPYRYNNGYPVYGKPGYGTPQNTQQPRKTNLGAYNPNSAGTDSSNYNPKTGKMNTGTTTAPVRTFGTPTNPSNNNGSGVGNIIRKVFTPQNNSSSGSSNNSSPSRTFDNSSSSPRTFDTRSSSSSSNSNSSTSTPSSSSSSSAPVRTFKKD